MKMKRELQCGGDLPEITRLKLDESHVKVMRLLEGVGLETAHVMRSPRLETGQQGAHSYFKLSGRCGRST